MIRVIVERQLKHGEDLGQLLTELKMLAILQKGHVSGETLMSVHNRDIVAIISTWQSLDDWQAWESSKEREELLKKINPLLAKEKQVKVFEIMSPQDCAYFEDPVCWMQEHEHPHFAG